MLESIANPVLRQYLILANTHYDHPTAESEDQLNAFERNNPGFTDYFLGFCEENPRFLDLRETRIGYNHAQAIRLKPLREALKRLEDICEVRAGSPSAKLN